jgi:hypothetical protein
VYDEGAVVVTGVELGGAGVLPAVVVAVPVAGALVFAVIMTGAIVMISFPPVVVAFVTV